MRRKQFFTPSFFLKVVFFFAIVGLFKASTNVSDPKQEHYKIRSFDYTHMWDKDSDMKITKENQKEAQKPISEHQFIDNVKSMFSFDWLAKKKNALLDKLKNFISGRGSNDEDQDDAFDEQKHLKDNKNSLSEKCPSINFFKGVN